LKLDSYLVILSYHEDKDAGLQKEVAVGTVIQYQQRGSADRHQRWERIERAEQCERYGALKAQGMSQRQAAKVLAHSTEFSGGTPSLSQYA